MRVEPERNQRVLIPLRRAEVSASEDTVEVEPPQFLPFGFGEIYIRDSSIKHRSRDSGCWSAEIRDPQLGFSVFLQWSKCWLFVTTGKGSCQCVLGVSTDSGRGEIVERQVRSVEAPDL